MQIEIEHIFTMLPFTTQAQGTKQRGIAHGIVDRNEKNDRLRLRESKERGVFVEGLTEKKVPNLESMMSLIDHARKVAAVASTAMNERSSRSHMVITVAVSCLVRRSQQKSLNFVWYDFTGFAKVQGPEDHADESLGPD